MPNKAIRYFLGLICLANAIGCSTTKSATQPTVQRQEIAQAAPTNNVSEAIQDQGVDNEDAPQDVPTGDVGDVTDANPIPPEESVAGMHFASGSQAFRKGDYAMAAASFQSAVDSQPAFYIAQYNHALAKLASRDIDSGIQSLERTLQIRPYHTHALVLLYQTLKSQGRQSEAEQLVTKALRDHSDRAGSHVLAAHQALDRNDMRKVEQESRSAIRFNEREVEAMRLMGIVFYRKAQYETAKFAFENAIVLEPGNALLHLELSRTYLKLKDDEKARQSAGRARSLRSDLGDAHEIFGVLSLKRGDKELALNALKSAEDLKPTNPQTIIHAANAYRANGKLNDALERYNKALELNSSLRQVYFNRGILYLDGNFPDMDLIVRLDKAQSEFDLFKGSGEVEGDLKQRLTDYESALAKSRKREVRKRERAASKAREDDDDDGLGDPSEEDDDDGLEDPNDTDDEDGLEDPNEADDDDGLEDPNDTGDDDGGLEDPNDADADNDDSLEDPNDTAALADELDALDEE